MITQRTMKAFLSVIAVLLTLLAYIEAAQAATWQFKDAVIVLPQPGPPLSLTGEFMEQGGNIPFWDILAVIGQNLEIEFTSVPGGCFIQGEMGEPCLDSATVLSPTALSFEHTQANGPSGTIDLKLELAAPLNSGADTIELVPGQSDFRGSVLFRGGLSPGPGLITGSITTIPEPQTITTAALGLALLVCLHMMVRRRFGKLQWRVTT